MPTAAENWKPFFDPRGVAVVGASRDTSKLGYGIARNLTRGGFAGAVYFVNPNVSGELFGREFYAGVADVPDPVDLAVILVRAQLVPEVLDNCGARGIGAAIIASGGFRETGSEGAALETECVAVARAHGIRLLGPNCIGTIDTHTAFNATFLAPPGPHAGEVALVSHSGALCAAVIDWAADRRFGFSRLVSLGNQADINEIEALQMVAADPRTSVVTVYLESLSDGRALVEQARRMNQPVVVFKAGRGEGGRRAVLSHTGSMAGREDAYRAAVRRAGIIPATTLEEMFDGARALAEAPLPAGRAVAVLTNAGGPGVAAVDALERRGLSLARISAPTWNALQKALPAGASVANPIDMLASASPRDFGRCLTTLIDAHEVDSVLVAFAPPPMYPASAVAESLLEAAGTSPKPVVVAVMGGRSIGSAVEQLRTARIPEFRFPEQAANALAMLVARAETKTGESTVPTRPDGIRSEAAAAVVTNSPAGWLTPGATADVLDSYGIPTPPQAVVNSADEAVRAANLLGDTVALKLVAADLSHKSDVGGVRLGLASGDEIRSAYSDLLAVATDRAQPATVCVQPMVDGTHDLIIGAVRDPQFGPVLMFGSGGIEIEGLGDVEFALAPPTEDDVTYLLAQTWAGRRLTGYRGIPAGDTNAVKEVMHRIGWLLADHPRVAEIEINPLRTPSPAFGTVALDARIRIE